MFYRTLNCEFVDKWPNYWFNNYPALTHKEVSPRKQWWQFTEGLLPLFCHIVLVSWSDVMFQNKVKSQTLFILMGTIKVTIHAITDSKTEKQNWNFATLKKNWSEACPLSHAVLSCKGKSALLITYTMYSKSCSACDPPSAYQASIKEGSLSCLYVHMWQIYSGVIMSEYETSIEWR